MSLTRNQIIIIGAVGLVILVLLLVLFGVLPGLKKEDPKAKIKTNLEFWGVFDSEESYNTVVAAYKGVYPGVTVNYRRFTDVAGYERALLDALASGSGPDVFMMRNRSLPRDIKKLFPVPQAKFSLLALRNLFPQTVESDFVSEGAIYALPVSLDTLALYYNHDHLDQAAITSPPANWDEFETAVPKLVKKENGELTRAGAALGGSSTNVENAADILSLLMLQFGVDMTDENFTRAEFGTRQGEAVLEFYTKFADPESSLYTWNDLMRGSVDAFAEGKASMMFGYASDKFRLTAKNPFLNFAVADFPQFAGSDKVISYPNYWGYAVSRQTKKPTLAWDFILTLATNKNNAKGYLDHTGRPPALRTLISEQANDPEMTVFARQALTARSWPQPDQNEVSRIFSDMISSANSGSMKISDILDKAEKEVTNLITKRF